MATPRPNYQGGNDIVLTPYLQSIGNILIANQQQAQAKAQAEQQRADKIYDSISAEAAKVNPDGLRSADYEGFQAMYQEQIKAPMIDALLARQNGDMATYAQKMAEVNAGIGTVNSFISRSKQESKFDYDLAEDIRKNPDRYSDQSTELYRTRLATPTTALSGNLQQGSEAWIRQVDTSKVQGQVDTILKDLFTTSGKLSGIDQQRAVIGGRGADVVQFEEAVEKDAFADAVRRRFSSDPAWRAFAEQNNLGATPEEAAINLTAAYEAAGRFQRTDGRQIVRDQAPSQSGGGSGTQAGVGDLVTGLDITYGPNDASVRANRYVGLQSTNVPLAGTPAINLTTGTNVAQIPENITDTRIVALAEIPVGATEAYRGMPITQDMARRFPNATAPKEVLIVQGKVKRGSRERVERFAIDRNALPANLSNNKVVQAAIAKFDQGAVQSPQNSVSLTDNSTKPKLSW